MSRHDTILQHFAAMNSSKEIAAPLLKWYDRHQRLLPWRMPAQQGARKAKPDPYYVWLSEIMLQQTTVATVIPYFNKFIEKWPTVDDLARASREEVLTAWAGLGYYTRARNLHACALVISQEYEGTFPASEKELLALPGVGPYTAAAIAAIAYDQPANVVDGNVERVIARVEASSAPKQRLKKIAEQFVPPSRNGDYAQALMDLGATICTPRKPKCIVCPLEMICEGRVAPDQFPRRKEQKPKPLKYASILILYDHEKRLWMRRRSDKGLLGGMYEFPSSPWLADVHPPESEEFLSTLTPRGGWRDAKTCSQQVRHIFTHFTLSLRVIVAQLDRKASRPEEGNFFTKNEIKTLALPTLMQKVLQAEESEKS